MEPQKKIPSTEEIDIIGFFQYLGKGFKKLGKGINKLLNTLFHILIFKPYVFYKRHFKLAIYAIALAFLLGVLADSLKKPIYYAELLVTPHYDSGKELYTRVNMYNSLLNEEKYDQLADILGVPVDQVKQYISFNIAPNINERIMIKTYSEFLHYIDSTTKKEIPYEKYKFTFQKQKFDYPQQVLSVKAKVPDVFYPLNRHFETLLDDEPLFRKRRDVVVKIYEDEINYIKESIAQADSLREAIDQAIKGMGKVAPAEGGTNIVVGGAQIELPEKKYDLFKKKNTLLGTLRQLQRDKIEMQKILLLNSFFPKNAKEYNPWWRIYKISFVLSIIVLLLAVFYFMDLIHYLEKKYNFLHGQQKAGKDEDEKTEA